MNRENLLKETLEALSKQTTTVFEVIVVDDGGNDGSREVVNHFGTNFKYYRQENSGPQSARNLGISKCSGSWIAFLDDDDLWEPSRLEIIQKIIQKEDIDLIVSDFSIFDKNGIKDKSFFKKHAAYFPNFWINLKRQNEELYSVFDPLPPLELFPEYPFWGGTLVVTKNKIQQIDGWDPTVRGIPSEDLDFVFRVVKDSRFALIWEPTILYRSHAGNVSRDSTEKLQGRIEIAKLLKNKNILSAEEIILINKFINKSQTEVLWIYFKSKNYKKVLEITKKIDQKSLPIEIKMKIFVSYLLIKLQGTQ